MTAWARGDLNKIGTAEELEIAYRNEPEKVNQKSP